MKLNFINIQELDFKCKCYIHKTGKLGFSSNAVKKMGLDKNKFIRVATEEGDKEYNKIYLEVTNSPDQAFKVNSAGLHFYLNMKILWDLWKIDYIKNKIIYDIVEDTYDGGKKIFKLTKRVLKK